MQARLPATRRRRAVGLAIAFGVMVVLAGCSAPDAPASSSAAGSSAAGSSGGWNATLAAARGQTVNLWMYGGDPQGNAYVDNVLAPAAASLGVTLRRVAISDTKDVVNRILAEKQAGRSDGSVDLVWVNGGNFATGKQAGIWDCGWAQSLPNSQYLDPKDPLLSNDFGVSTDGCEAPWHKAQFTLVYDSARVTDPPRTIPALLIWAKVHPGRFTYPAPPDFTGSVFVRQALYGVAGGFAQIPSTYSSTAFNKVTPPLYAALHDVAPSLWRQGATYPRDSVALDKLFADGQVDFTMTYGPATLTNLVAKGTFPTTTRVLTLDGGTVGNASFLAMPANAADKAGAQVVANLALSPAQQLAKANPSTWGQFTVLDQTRLSANERAAFEALPISPVVPAYPVLSRDANPELSSAWVTPIDEGWRRSVLAAR